MTGGSPCRRRATHPDMQKRLFLLLLLVAQSFGEGWQLRPNLGTEYTYSFSTECKPTGWGSAGGDASQAHRATLQASIKVLFETPEAGYKVCSLEVSGMSAAISSAFAGTDPIPPTEWAR